MTIYIINNFLYPPYIKNHLKYFKSRKVPYVLVPKHHDISKYVARHGKPTAIILSGSELRVTEPIPPKYLRASLSALEYTDVPILGVCFGFQLIAAYSGQAKFGSLPNLLIKDGIQCHVSDEFSLLFKNKSKTFPVQIGLTDYVTSFAPKSDFRITAIGHLPTVSTSVIMAYEHTNRPLYAVTFHPHNREDTWDIYETFIKHSLHYTPLRITR